MWGMKRRGGVRGERNESEMGMESTERMEAGKVKGKDRGGKWVSTPPPHPTSSCLLSCMIIIRIIMSE